MERLGRGPSAGGSCVAIAPDTSGFNDGQPHVAAFSRIRATGALELFVDGVSAAIAIAVPIPALGTRTDFASVTLQWLDWAAGAVPTASRVPARPFRVALQKPNLAKRPRKL
jgi:hypothetical protein